MILLQFFCLFLFVVTDWKLLATLHRLPAKALDLWLPNYIRIVSVDMMAPESTYNDTVPLLPACYETTQYAFRLTLFRKGLLKRIFLNRTMISHFTAMFLSPHVNVLIIVALLFLCQDSMVIVLVAKEGVPLSMLEFAIFTLYHFVNLPNI